MGKNFAEGLFKSWSENEGMFISPIRLSQIVVVVGYLQQYIIDAAVKSFQGLFSPNILCIMVSYHVWIIVVDFKHDD